MEIVRLQRSWGYLRRASGVEVASWLSGGRLFFRTPESHRVLTVMKLLATGVRSERLVGDIVRASGLDLLTVQALLTALSKRGALIYQQTQGQSADREGRYSRQIEFLRFFESSQYSGESYNSTLQHSTIAIVGLGGYGTWIALLCAMMGVSRIVAIDPDVVELSNLNRQVLYKPSDVGRLKIDAASEAIAALESGTTLLGHALRIDAAGDLVPLLADVDLIFDPFDYVPPTHTYPTSMHIVRAAKLAQIPTVSLGGSWVGPLTIPGLSPCYWCLSANEELREALDASYAVTEGSHASRGAAFAPRVVVPVGIAVYEASRYLAGIDNSSIVTGIVTIDQQHHLRDRFVPINRNESCVVCGEGRGG